MLVADGGSSDGSLEELERWAIKDSRVRIVSRADSGPAHALNPFKEARGTIIGWLMLMICPRSFGSCDICSWKTSMANGIWGRDG